MPRLPDPKHEASDWYDESVTLPKMDIVASDRFPGPVGFIDFDRLRAKAENGRNVRDRHCQIRTVRLKMTVNHLSYKLGAARAEAAEELRRRQIEADAAIRAEFVNQPPVDNDHVAPGATKFTDEEIRLNSFEWVGM